jgi:tetratricopeptide (TPR) repeat protein
VNAYRNALEVYTRAQLPQNWAAAQENLGMALWDLARRSDGPQAAAYLEQAAGAFRNALEVYTRQQLPQDWAMTQNNLGFTLRDLAGRSEWPQAAAYLEQAVVALQGALEVRTEASLPHPWTQTMWNLAVTYEQKQDWAHALETYERLAHHYPEDSSFRAKVEELSKRR